MKIFVKIIIPFIIGFIVFQLFFQLVLKHNNTTPQSTDISKTDSLQNVINDLQIELNQKNQEWDKAEDRYELALFEYKYGIDAIKIKYPDAYREFHRIIAFKENYNRVDEIENNKRLSYGKFNK